MNDFISNGYYGELPLQLDKTLCPATETVKDYYMLTNGYANIANKKSFAIEVLACNDVWVDSEEGCASKEDVEDFVSHIVLT